MLSVAFSCWWVSSCLLDSIRPSCGLTAWPCAQARSYEEATSSILGWYLRNAQTRALSHPLPVMRAREIDQWARSSQYRALVNKNRIRRGLPVTSSAISSD